MTTHEDSVATHLHILAGQCGGGSCPTVYGTDRETVVVQGYALSGESAGVEVPSGECIVEIPTEVLLAAADKIRSRA